MAGYGGKADPLSGRPRSVLQWELRAKASLAPTARKKVRTTAGTKNKWHCIHKDCKYKTRPGSPNGCDYTYMTGKDRRAGLPKEKHAPYYCDKYEPGGRKRRKAADIKLLQPTVYTYQMPVSRSREYEIQDGLEMLRQYHAAGMSDTEIAAALNWTAGKVKYWRHDKLKLPNNTGNPKGAPVRLDWDLGYKLYKEGKTNREIADSLGASIKTVQGHMKKHHWGPPNT